MGSEEIDFFHLMIWIILIIIWSNSTDGSIGRRIIILFYFTRNHYNMYIACWSAWFDVSWLWIKELGCQLSFPALSSKSPLVTEYESYIAKYIGCEGYITSENFKNLIHFLHVKLQNTTRFCWKSLGILKNFAFSRKT